MTPPPADPAKAAVEAESARSQINGRLAEQLAAWSTRWRDAAAASAANAAARTAAIKAHVDRMARLESHEFLLKEMKDSSSYPLLREFFGYSKFFRLEAEAALARESRK